MSATNFDVTGLTDYINANRDLLIASFGLSQEGTRSRVTTITGVKYKERLNYLEIEPELQDGSDCGFTPQDGGLALTERDVEVAPIKVDIEICPRTLRKKYANYLIRMNAKAEGERLPFEAEVLNGVVDQINKKIEKLIWRGVKGSSDTDIKWINGWTSLFIQEGTEVDSVNGGLYNNLVAMYFALSNEVIKRGAEIYLNPALFRQFLQEMVVKNYYHYAGPQDSAPNEFILPGTNVKVVSTEGLEGDYEIYATFPANLVYATDMEGDEEDIDLWYSKDDRTWKLEALWVSGVQVYFPELAYWMDYDTTPTIPVSPLDKIASAVNKDNQIETHPNS